MHNPTWTLSEIGQSTLEVKILLRKASSQWLPVPHSGIWGGQATDIQTITDLFLELLPESQHLDFYQTLAASWLLSPQEAPMSLPGWLSVKIAWAELSGTSIASETMACWRWQTVPIALVNERESLVRMILVGGHNDPGHERLPSWAHRVLSPDARAAIDTAADLAEKKFPGQYFYYWPIFPRSANGSQVIGASLGLSAYLGAFSVGNDFKVPNVLPTGVVTSDKRIEAVRNLREKRQKAVEKNYEVFLCPDTFDVGCLQELKTTCTISIRTLPEAEKVWLNKSTEYKQDVADFERLFSSSDRLIETLPDFDGPSLFLIEAEEDRISTLLNNKSKEKSVSFISALKTFTDKIETQLGRPNWDKRKVPLLLRFFPLDLVDEICSFSPDIAFRLALVQHKVANHLGIGQITAWNDLAETCCTKISTHDADEKKLEYFINRFVGSVHNNYRFVANIPMEFEEVFSDLVPYLEGEYVRTRARKGHCVHYPLGCYYGTMMQHYAFCGPEYLGQTLEYSHKSREAFGNGYVEGYCEDYLRQFCYLTYAYLDAGDFAKAEEALKTYLEIDSLRNFPFQKEKNPFKHAVFARYLADSSNQFPEYVDWAKEVTEHSGHPWQLWFYNVGRIAVTDEEKRTLFLKSIDICRANPLAIRLMGLLPIYEMIKNKWAADEIIGSFIRELKILGAEDRYMSTVPPDEGQIKRLFPFIYR